MPKLKYYQEVVDLHNYLNDAELEVKVNQRNHKDIYEVVNKSFLQKYQVSMEDLPVLLQERDAIRYLLACQKGVHNYHKDELKQPDFIHILNALNRYEYYLEWVNREVLNKLTGEQKEYRNKKVKKEQAMIELYTQRFQDVDEWVLKLPKTIPSIHSRKQG